VNQSPWYSIINASEIPSPALLIYPDRVRENLERMIALVGDVQRLRPHVKTHKLPQVIAMKRLLGIDKFKTSTIAEAEMTASAGGRDVLLAYQPVGPAIGRLVTLIQRFPNTHFTALVDNLESLAEIARSASAANILISLYVDLNVGMNRTGIVPGPDALSLYKAMCVTPGVRPSGLHAYDGHIHENRFETLVERSTATFAPVWRLRDELRSLGLPVPNIIASGTPTSRLLAQYEGVEVGAGTTVLWDFGQEDLTPDLDFLNAAVLLCRVISRPTENRLCIDLGHKAVASEMPHPRVRFFGLEDAVPVGHSEEHLVLETPRASEYPVGTILYGIPRHVCPTVALHSEVWSVREGQAQETWPVVARTRRISI
jgi:D-serine deaminase-like pyridoxal phosphate-dependent protein